MPHAAPILNSFTSGEISPRLAGRTDLTQYFQGCKTLQNMIVHPHGGASKRFGTHFVAETKSSATASLVIPFVYGVTQAYVLEFGDRYFRVYMNEGQIVSPAGTPIEFTTPYNAVELPYLKFVQDEDTMYIFHPTGAEIRKLVRYSHYAWSLATTTWASKPTTWATNYPSCGAFYEQRLFLGGHPDFPQRIWGSEVGNYESMSSGTDASDAVEYEIAAEDVNVIRWMTATRYLMIGTAGGAWMMSSGSDDTAITPSAIKVRREDNSGSAQLQAKVMGKAIAYLSRTSRKIRQFIYDYTTDSWDTDDLTLISEHITEGGIEALAYAPEPDSILWTVRADGHFPGMTYERKQKVLAWHDHVTDGEVVSLCSIPLTDHDQVWMIVKREINGSDRYYVEFMEDDFGTDLDAAWFVDSGLSYSGAAASTVSGLSHLEGKSVAVLADGANCTRQTVASGAINIGISATSITVGLPFEAVLEPMRIDAGSANGTAQGKFKKIPKVAVRFYRTVGAKIGTEDGDEDEIPFRVPGDAMSSAVPLFTGDKEVTVRSGWDRDGYIRITSEDPLPMTVLSIMPKVITND